MILPAYFLIGLPGAGKSTFRAKLVEQHPDIAVVSTDDMIEAKCRATGRTYSEVFPGVDMKALEGASLISARGAYRSSKPVAVDRTLLRRASREKYLRRLRPAPNDVVRFMGEDLVPTYHTIGVLFPVPEELHRQRLQARAEATGKHIPWEVIETMRASYEPPQVGEFDEVWVVDPHTGKHSVMEDFY
ncbi:ATP-binding protein [Roseomonas sp. GC11]|uniref:ATP-binding protein n=1 Tax=Roseomonas sp. GC11 TaxID=2950546 RepID=UPI002109CD13|nr:ATP-binding protein [Roseomonas sp. GC11]MCQ4158767.1 ATP-binding protein [Roseomonas sp. GC11]